MKKSLIALALLSAFAVPAFAEEAAAPAAEAPALTGNVGLFSSYRFRGIDQTFGKPALQGGFDYAHASGLYVGNWNSNVSEGAGYPSASLEMDFYGGYKATFGDFGVDAGGIYYYYPGSDANLTSVTQVTNGKTTKVHTGAVNNKELYIGGSWKTVSLKYYHSIGDYFSVPETKGTGYLDLSASFDLGEGWGINGHVGSLAYKNYRSGAGDNGKYTDWKLGVTKDISGWVVGASYVGTNAKAGTCNTTNVVAGTAGTYCFANSLPVNAGSSVKDAGRDTVILSVTKAF